MKTSFFRRLAVAASAALATLAPCARSATTPINNAVISGVSTINGTVTLLNGATFTNSGTITGAGNITTTGTGNITTLVVGSGNITAQGWATNLANQFFYFEGSSITRGYGLGTAQLPGGGLTGNFGDLLTKSIWGAGKNNTQYNDGVDGTTSTQVLARFTTGNAVYGVTVPSAHSLSPTVTGSTTRHIYFIDLTEVYNDANNGISTATSISNLTTLTTTARSEGWFVVLLTCPIINTTTASKTAQIAAVNKAARDGTIPSDLVAPMDTWIPNQFNTVFYQDAIHPTAQGHILMAADLTAGMISGGFPVNYSGNYFSNPVFFGSNITGNVLIDAQTSTLTSSPVYLSLGGTYGNATAGQNTKLKIYDDGTLANTGGIGQGTGNKMEVTAPSGADIVFYVNGATPTALARITAQGNLTTGTISATAVAAASASPSLRISPLLYGTGNKAVNKLVVYDDPGNVVNGMGVDDANGWGFFEGPNGLFKFYTGTTNVIGTGASLAMTISGGATTITTSGAINSGAGNITTTGTHVGGNVTDTFLAGGGTITVGADNTGHLQVFVSDETLKNLLGPDPAGLWETLRADTWLYTLKDDPTNELRAGVGARNIEALGIKGAIATLPGGTKAIKDPMAFVAWQINATRQLFWLTLALTVGNAVLAVWLAKRARK